MKLSKTQLTDVLSKLPSFHRYEYDYFQVPVMMSPESILTRAEDITPTATIELLTFVKDWRLRDWVLKEIVTGGKHIALC